MGEKPVGVILFKKVATLVGYCKIDKGLRGDPWVNNTHLQLGSYLGIAP